MALIVNDVEPRVELVAAAAQTVFSFNFLILEEQDLTVIQIPDATGIAVTLVNPTDYTIDPGSVENNSGGSITLVNPAAVDDQIIIFRDTVITRNATFTTGGNFPATTVEREESDQYLIMQELQRDIQRSLSLPDSLTGVSTLTAPTPVDGGKAWVWDEAEDGTLRNSVVNVDDLGTAVADAQAAAAVATAAAASASSSETNAATSEANAASSAAETLYIQVTDISFADSPFTPAALDEGTLYRVDTSGGPVVVNLSDLATYAEDMKFAFVKVTGDANTVTINRGGADTFDAGATSIVISDQQSVTDIIGQLSGGVWQSITPGVGGGGATTFTGLTDTPGAYGGASLQAVRVNAGETGLEFFNIPAGGDMNTATYDPGGVSEQLAGLTAAQTLTNKTINGSSNTITNVSLTTGVTGNLPVGNLNSGTGAGATTFWRGDGTWATPVASVPDTYGAVGTYIFAYLGGVGSSPPGGTVAGGTLTPTDAAGNGSSVAPAGTWRNMGGAVNSAAPTQEERTTLWIRIA